jgi:hypothetical protein
MNLVRELGGLDFFNCIIDDEYYVWNSSSVRLLITALEKNVDKKNSLHIVVLYFF